MVQESESLFVLRDGTELFEKTWKPSEPIRAHLIFLHGFSDRSEIQYYLFPTLASPPLNIACHAIDQRGWGKSVRHPSQRGLTGPTSQVLADIDEYVAHVSSKKISDLAATPLFLMGHSMGGQEVLHYLLSTSSSLVSRSQILGAIIEAPYIELDPKSQPSSLLVMAGRAAAIVSPKSQMKQSLDEKYVTRDPKVNQAWKEDELCHGYGTLEGLRDMLQRGADLVTLSRLPKAKRADESPKGLGLSTSLPVPVYWAHGTADRITAFSPSKRLYDALNASDLTATRSVQGNTFKAYEGAYHKVHAEPRGVGVAFAQDIGSWVLNVAQSRSQHADRGTRPGITSDVARGPQGQRGAWGRGDDRTVTAKL